MNKLIQILRKNYGFMFFFRKLRSLLPYRLRKLDSEFWYFYNLLNESEKLPIDEIKKIQFENLKNIVSLAYSNTDFYREKYDLCGFHPSNLKSFEDIEKIPFLTKDEIRGKEEKLVLKDFKKSKLQKAVTSGTSGKSLVIYQNKKTESREWASICFQWARVGYRPGDGRIEFRGLVENGRDFIFLPDERVLRINILKMSKSNLKTIVQEILKSNYSFIHGYPSAVAKFSSLLWASNLKLNDIKGVMLASEAVYEWQLEIIDRAFDCKKIAHYGQAEKVALGAWNLTRSYEFLPLYSLVEISKNSNEIIGTSLINHVMPMIRYKTGDVAIESSVVPQAFFPIALDVSGRLEDITYSDTGETIPPAIVTFPFKHLQEISNAQIIQREIGSLELIIEVNKNPNVDKLNFEIDTVIQDLKKIYGSNTRIDVKQVLSLQIEKSGKFKWIKCEIKNDKINS